MDSLQFATLKFDDVVLQAILLLYERYELVYLSLVSDYYTIPSIFV